MLNNEYCKRVYEQILARDPDQKEFHQAVYEVLEGLEPMVERRPELEKNGILDSLKVRAKKLSTALNKLDGVSCLSVDGALYTYFRLTMPPKAIAAAKKMGKAADAMYCMDLLNEAGVVCVPGSGFGQEEGTYHVRSTILPPENEIDQVVERMNNFHKKWMAKYN